MTQSDAEYDGPVLGVIGWDAGTFVYLEPLLAEGKLPNLARLMDSGSDAELISTVPPMTPVAWSTITTGCNPGKHGVFNWWHPSDRYELVPYTASSVQVPNLFGILAAAGHTVGAVNVPMTGGPLPGTGFVLGGLTGPGFGNHAWSDSVHPAGVASDLAEQFPELVSDDDAAFRAASSEDDLLALWQAHEQTRLRAIRYLVRQHRPDVLWVHCHAGDYFGHRLGAPSPIMDAAFQLVDETIGAMLDVCREDAHVVVVSDHGQTEITKFVLMQNHLELAGLLFFKDDVSREQFGRAALAALRHNRIDVLAEELEETILLLAGAYYELPQHVRAAVARRVDELVPGALKAHDNIDWTRTRAFCASFYGHVYVNLRGRQAEGIVDPDDYDSVVAEIVAGLTALEDPATGLPVGITATRRADVYHGPTLEQAPDVVCSLEDPSYYLCPIFSLHLGEPETVVPIDHVAIGRAFRFGDLSYRGDHTSRGIFVVSGPSVREQGRQPPIAAQDVAPTLLALMGVQALPHMDGFPQWGLRPSEGPGRPPDADVTPDAESDAARVDLMQDLRRLGYRI